MSDKRTNPYYVAQAILSHRDHSVAEMAQKLKRRGFTADDITKVLHELHKQRLLDDVTFTRTYIEQTLRARAVGRRWLQHKLQQKGVAVHVITEALNELVPPERETELKAQATERWEERHPGGDRQKRARYLASRGFSLY